MKRTIYLLLIIGLSLTASICKKEDTENCHHRITFHNNSARTVYVRMTEERYYDSGFPNPYLSPEYFKTKPGEINRRALSSRDCLESHFVGEYGAEEKLIFIIDEAVLQTYSWDEILEKRLFLKEYRLTLDDLRRIEWKLTYSDND
jgi:hypothetical protein